MNTRQRRAAPPTIRARFFRQHCAVAVLAVLIAAGGVYGASYRLLRHLLVDALLQTAISAGHVYAQAAPPAGALDAFADHPGVTLLCVYNREGTLAASVQKNAALPCPPLLTASGIVIDRFRVRISQPIERHGQYRGMVYLQGEMAGLAQLQQAAALLLPLTLLLAILGCRVSAGAAARSMVGCLLALQRQIECLKEHEIDFCPLDAPVATRETMALADGVASLRAHLARTMVANETVAHLRHWHWELLAALLARLCHRIDADSPLLDDLNDYALLLRIENGDRLSKPKPFDMRAVLDAALASARRIAAPDGTINLTLSMQPQMPPQWIGHAAAVEALLRHLLLIGLARTRRGFVCLRLESVPQLPERHRHRLRVYYEDSGPPMQPGQLHQWLNPAGDRLPETVAHDISWLLVAGIVKYMGGTLTSIDHHPAAGIMLEAALPLSIPAMAASPPPVPTATAIASDRAPPLVLVVEPGKEMRATLAALFAAAHAEVVIVETHAQAVELAPILPCSAILLQAALDKPGEDVTRRLRHLMEDGVMAEIPLWVMLAKSSYLELDYWHRRGVSEWLLPPLQLETLQPICAALAPRDVHFYQQHDTGLRRELPSSIHAAMPQMNRLLAEQIAAAHTMLAMFMHGAPTIDAVHTAHALKSAALTLGYFRLAGLMGQIEHAHSSRIFAAWAPNWQVIIAMLQSSGIGMMAGVAAA